MEDGEESDVLGGEGEGVRGEGVPAGAEGGGEVGGVEG